MSDSFGEVIRRHSRALEPIETNERPVLREIGGVRAVLFDVYGTLLISSSGDIGAVESGDHGSAFCEALLSIGVQFHGDGEVGVQLFEDEIRASNSASREQGNEYPEVDIVAIWRRVLSIILKDGRARSVDSNQTVSASEVATFELQRLALEYEMRVNPVWTMPHARECLKELCDSGLSLGIISNAQFFTLEILQTLLPADSHGFEFDQKLQYYSYQHARAKPGLSLYQFASDCLAQRGIRGSEVLYIGNDMLKDVMPAGAIGFRTALFAGDARSLRHRTGDPRVDGVTPDLVITDLMDIPKCIL